MRYSAHARLSRVSPRRARGLCRHVCLPARSAGRDARAMVGVSAYAPAAVGALPSSGVASCGRRVINPGRHRATHAPARPGTLGAPSGEVGSWERRCVGSPHPYSEYGFEAGGCSGCGRTHSRAERSRMCATLYPRVHSRAPSRAPTCAEDEVDGEDPGPSQGLDVRTWIRRIVTTGASSQDAFGRC